MSSAMSSVSAACLLTPRRCSLLPSLRPSRFAPRRPAISPRLPCRGTGSRRGCLLDMRRAGDEMMRCSCPRAFSLSFSFRPAPSPRLFPICLLQFVPPPSGSGEARANVDLRVRAACRFACLSSFSCRSLAHRSFAFPVDLRSAASLLA